jgi:hypothetical protein
MEKQGHSEFRASAPPPAINIQNVPIRIPLLWGLPVDVADKVKVAASFHRQSMRESTVEVLAARLKELERNGSALPLPKGK